jgi:hypothetical protein
MEQHVETSAGKELRMNKNTHRCRGRGSSQRSVGGSKEGTEVRRVGEKNLPWCCALRSAGSLAKCRSPTLGTSSLNRLNTMRPLGWLCRHRCASEAAAGYKGGLVLGVPKAFSNTPKTTHPSAATSKKTFVGAIFLQLF